jgi:hypothetical protein
MRSKLVRARSALPGTWEKRGGESLHSDWRPNARPLAVDGLVVREGFCRDFRKHDSWLQNSGRSQKQGVFGSAGTGEIVGRVLQKSVAADGFFSLSQRRTCDSARRRNAGVGVALDALRFISLRVAANGVGCQRTGCEGYESRRCLAHGRRKSCLNAHGGISLDAQSRIRTRVTLAERGGRFPEKIWPPAEGRGARQETGGRELGIDGARPQMMQMVAD